MCWVEFYATLEVLISCVELAKFHAGSGSVQVVFWVAVEEVYGSGELYVGSFVVLPVEAESSQGVVVKTKSWLNEVGVSTEIKSIMVV